MKPFENLRDDQIPEGKREWVEAVKRGDLEKARELEKGFSPFARAVLSVVHIPGVWEDPMPEEAEREWGRHVAQGLAIMLEEHGRINSSPTSPIRPGESTLS